MANADNYIDYGMDQASCNSAAEVANATGHHGSFCYQTGPGHYTLLLSS